MKSIGFRVTHNTIFYSIIEFNKKIDSINCSEIIVPSALNLPEKLSFVKTLLNTIILNQKIEYAGIKLMEGNARNGITNETIIRFYFEGVIMEIFANSTIQHYSILLSNSILKILNEKKYDVDSLLSKHFDLKEVKTDRGYKLKDTHKEAILIAFTAIKDGNENGII